MELLEENTGTSFRRNNLTRLRRGRDSESPPAGSRRRKNVIDSDDDLDDEATRALMELLAALGEHSVEYVARWVASAQVVGAVPGIGASPIDSWREGSMLTAHQACKPNHARAASSCNTSWASCSR